MTEKLEKALEELNDLMSQVNALQKGEEEQMPLEEDMEYMATEDDEKADGEDEMESASYADEAEKALDEDSTRDYEAGEEVVSGGNPTATPAPLKVSKEWDASDFSTLDLSAENVEKAYEQFKAEQLEKIAYENLNKQFEERFATEQSVRKAQVERNEYDARSEVAELKEQFAELRKSLTTTEDSQIIKGENVTLPEGFPTTSEEISSMSWGDIHNLANKF